MSELEFLKLIRDKLPSELRDYIKDFLPDSVSFRWKDPIYRKIYRLKKHLVLIKQKEKDINIYINYLLDDCFEPSSLKNLSILEKQRDDIQNMIYETRKTIVELNNAFLQKNKQWKLVY